VRKSTPPDSHGACRTGAPDSWHGTGDAHREFTRGLGVGSRHGAHSQAPVQGRVAIAQRSDHDAESTSTRLRYLDGPTYEVSLRGAAATPRDASERRLPHT
jgi:hypothetical protein